MFFLPIRENISVPLTLQKLPPQKIESMVQSLAERFGIASQLDKYPHELSGGQRQRASAARAIVKRPSILFADEPTGALDSSSATELLNALYEASKKLHTTILMVTHDAYAASFAARILIFKDGWIIRELMNQGTSRRDFYEAIAFKNLKKNFAFYTLYILSVSLVFTIYFAFTSFSMNTVMLEKISEDGRVESMCRVISVFLIVFVIFYMSYSNRFFLRRRTKEFGIYALLGYRRENILSLLLSENIIIGACSLITGLLLGTMMHKGIVYGTTVLLGLSIDHAKIPFFNFSAVVNTTVFILGILFVMALSNARFLFQTSLMDLVRFEKSAERKMKFRKTPALLGFLLVIAGYGLALDIFRGTDSLWFSVGFYQTALMTALSICSCEIKK